MDDSGRRRKGDETSPSQLLTPDRTSPSYRWRILLAIYCGSVLVRGLTALTVDQPGFTDSFYYFNIAKNLFAGRGFVEDFVWNYLEGSPAITHPSNTYWGPLASILIQPGFWLFGPSFRAAQLPMVLTSALLPVLTYVIAHELKCTQRQAAIATVLTIFSGVYTVYWVVPEAFVPFAVAGTLSLYAASKGACSGRRWMALCGASAALAQLARTDGALLLVAVVVATMVASWHAARDRIRSYLAGLACMGCAYLLLVTPWLAHTWLSSGSAFSGPGLKTLFLREYNDVFSLGKSIDLRYFLGWGWEGILSSKILAALANANVVSEAVSYILLPLVVVGIWSLRRRAGAAPFISYAILLVTTMTVAFTFPGPLGSLLHSLTALLPFLMVCATIGLDRAIEWLIHHRPHLDQRLTRRFCSSVLVGSQVLLTVALTAIAVKQWESRYSYALYPAAGTLLDLYLQPNEPVMVVDPPAFFFFNQRPAIAVPNNSPDIVLDAARKYGVKFLILETAHVRPLDAMYRGEQTHPGFTLLTRLQNDRGQALKIYELDL